MGAGWDLFGLMYGGLIGGGIWFVGMFVAAAIDSVIKRHEDVSEFAEEDQKKVLFWPIWLVWVLINAVTTACGHIICAPLVWAPRLARAWRRHQERRYWARRRDEQDLAGDGPHQSPHRSSRCPGCHKPYGNG